MLSLPKNVCLYYIYVYILNRNLRGVDDANSIGINSESVEIIASTASALDTSRKSASNSVSLIFIKLL